jgi:hypothetical protein
MAWRHVLKTYIACEVFQEEPLACPQRTLAALNQGIGYPKPTRHSKQLLYGRWIGLRNLRCRSQMGQVWGRAGTSNESDAEHRSC